ncbi:hypothetical protein BKA82DRAFT_11138 [Pisolithus tinctorius]|uniref:AMP-dependent synthetase/ligase domain-containing protein n=1 Tax=Pisolithus tinctorius Marx 270 TaxID=870435 RepID=A0A0C3IEM8_PISTI|nr:hypothetical protein BKA82DRAFT_11138 [Pisolithus tinctorius]KIN95482.1 hypothetical protein M404DRAFT_11138 [Pisolithus tinctorius Marx 270]
MKGYLNISSATTAADDGWFETGDIAVCNKVRFFTIVDRRKELIKYKLESLLLQHPDTEATELPRTYIVPVRTVAKKTTSFAQGIQEWVARKVFPHKKLRGGIVLVGHIPGRTMAEEVHWRPQENVGAGRLICSPYSADFWDSIRSEETHPIVPVQLTRPLIRLSIWGSSGVRLL